MVAYQMRNALISAVVGVACLTAAGTAGAADTFSNSVTFLGDSVTAGFGYCGTEQLVTCPPNQEMADSWDDPLRHTNLRKCAPPGSPNAPTDACSNDNFDNGKPWQAPPWSAGPNAPTIAYPFQLAATQSTANPAVVSDWAVTGSTPSEWDPQGGRYGNLLGGLKQQYVVMTLGANPLLADFTDIKLLGKSVEYGRCVSSTGYQKTWFGEWYAGPLSNPVNCLKTMWNQLEQTQHLVRVYAKLLAQGDRVIVLGYYRGCSWSFGNWQVEGGVSPSDGNACKGETRPTSPTEPKRISQWEQSLAVGDALDKLIAGAVAKAKQAARTRWPKAAVATNIVYTRPDPAEWAQHQPPQRQGSWIFLNDTWIHPSVAGHANLAKTVAAKMCSAYGHWCGSPIRW
jgi:hypothetical protein